MTFDQEMERALIADGEKLRALTGEDHGPWDLVGDDEVLPPTFEPEEPAEVTELREQLATARAALREIADEPEIHTKLNEVRLCCKFQDIAIRALGGQP